MPIYEYQCTKCGDEFDAIQGFSDRPLKKCKTCGGKLEKLISECTFQLKGTGWYVTDYRKKDRSNEKKAHDEKKEKKTESSSKPDQDSSPKKKASAD
ncbi:MAG TPA: FmdB family zinc ribbon protein [Myxococcota bacterium]|nr:FmdB family zinc ribbon protein [Myxococcota bacterium]